MCSAPSSLFPKRTNSKPLRFETLPEWLNWQESLHFTAIELGLDRCRKVAERMNLLKPDFTVISIAGTNGKGSCATMLDMMLRRSEYKVATYTSPHLLNYNERVSINGAMVSDLLLCESFNRIDQARGDISLTYFEFGTLAALDIFHHAGIEIAIMEVGLGGRLDAVNILDADVSLVTTIDIDHEKWLGYDRESIGKEKAGIFRSMRPAVCADLNPPESVFVSADTIGARLYLSGRDFSFELEDETWHWRHGETQLRGLPKPSLNSNNQVQNAAGALMVLDAISERFPVNEETIHSSLRDFKLAGRFQIIPAENPYILDVAHNQQAASALAENLGKLPIIGKTHLVIGMLREKNHDAVLGALLDIVDNIYIVSLECERGASAEDLMVSISRLDTQDKLLKSYKDVPEAIEAARMAARPGDRIIITGSFVTVGEATRHLQIQH